MRRTRWPAVAGVAVGGLLLVSGLALEGLSRLLPVARDRFSRPLVSRFPAWAATSTGPRLAGSSLVVLGLAGLLAVGCGAVARGSRPGRRGGAGAVAGVVLLAAGLGTLAWSAPFPDGLVYLSPEQYDQLVVARDLRRAGEPVGAAGVLLLAAAAGWLLGARDRRPANGVLTSGDG